MNPIKSQMKICWKDSTTKKLFHFHFPEFNFILMVKLFKAIPHRKTCHIYCTLARKIHYEMKILHVCKRMERKKFFLYVWGGYLSVFYGNFFICLHGAIYRFAGNTNEWGNRRFNLLVVPIRIKSFLSPHRSPSNQISFLININHATRIKIRK